MFQDLYFICALFSLGWCIRDFIMALSDPGNGQPLVSFISILVAPLFGPVAVGYHLMCWQFAHMNALAEVINRLDRND